VFEKRVLRRVFRSEGYALTGDWKKLHNKDLYKLCFPSDTVKMISSSKAGHLARMGKKRTVYKVSVEVNKGKRQIRKHMRRLEGNYKMNLNEIECEFVDWIHMAEDSG
jgi:hypothetical protein